MIDPDGYGCWMTTNPQELIRQQFGANAANYATSTVHAKGASLNRLVEVMDPKASWQMLDIATAAGHTAFVFAPHVAEVVASDLLDEMLEVARGEAERRGIANVQFRAADAEALPFADASFDGVTCRIAPHHFADQAAFVSEVARVLRPGGSFGLVDNMVNTEASAFVNDWEQKRDPSHVLARSVDDWLGLITDAGLVVTSTETMAKRMEFAAWTENMSVPEPVRVELLAELETAPAAAAAYLRPSIETPGDQSSAAFHLTEGIITAVKPASN